MGTSSSAAVSEGSWVSRPWVVSSTSSIERGKSGSIGCWSKSRALLLLLLLLVLVLMVAVVVEDEAAAV
jgi:hypothetical protein